MLFNEFRFVAMISLLVHSSVAIDCYPGRAVDRKECQRAFSQIVYGNGDILGTDSEHFGYIYRNCSIIVLNLKGATPTKKQIESGFEQILDQCKPESGGGYLPAPNKEVFLNIGNRGAAQYESDFPFLKETCGLNTNAPDIKKKDCLKAYESIPLSVEGQFLTDSHTVTTAIKKTYETCTVDIYTSDGSKLIATNGNVRPIFKKMIDHCNDKSGVVSLSKGAQGQNGRLYLKTRSSIPCGLDDPKKQVCH